MYTSAYNIPFDTTSDLEDYVTSSNYEKEKKQVQTRNTYLFLKKFQRPSYNLSGI